MTHGKSKAEINRGQKLLILISLGYGKTQGVPHKSKSIAELGHADQSTEWFETGMEAVSLAPTAVNQQKFFFELKNGKVTVKNLGGFYSQIDLGIVNIPGHSEGLCALKITNDSGKYVLLFSDGGYAQKS